MSFRLNDPVNTPIGQGLFQGVFVDKAPGEPVSADQGMVRLPVNAETQKHLADSNCLTPKAKDCGLWVFKLHELQ